MPGPGTTILLCVAGVVLAALVSTCAIVLARATADPKMMIVNAGGHPVEHIKCIMLADGVAWTEQLAELGPGETACFSRATSNLFIQSVEYEFEGEPHRWQAGGIATPGETFKLSIDSQGHVSAAYDR